MADIRTLPVLPLRDIVVFPHMVVPLFVGRDKSVRALEEVMRTDKQILLATQKNSTDDDPKPADIYDVGVVASVLQMLKLPETDLPVVTNYFAWIQSGLFQANFGYLLDHPSVRVLRQRPTVQQHDRHAFPGCAVRSRTILHRGALVDDDHDGEILTAV